MLQSFKYFRDANFLTKVLQHGGMTVHYSQPHFRPNSLTPSAPEGHVAMYFTRVVNFLFLPCQFLLFFGYPTHHKKLGPKLHVFMTGTYRYCACIERFCQHSIILNSSQTITQHLHRRGMHAQHTLSIVDKCFCN